MTPEITVVMPSIPTRGFFRARAIDSVGDQTLQAHAISVAIDNDRQGAGPTRTRALFAARTEWAAFLDDDDFLLPHHLETLWKLAQDTDADVTWSWFRVANGTVPGELVPFQGQQWDPYDPHMFPITTMVRTQLALDVGGFQVTHPSGEISGEDHPFFVALSEGGAKFAHIPEVTWVWDHGTSNTSGLPSRW